MAAYCPNHQHTHFDNECLICQRALQLNRALRRIRKVVVTGPFIATAMSMLSVN